MTIIKNLRPKPAAICLAAGRFQVPVIRAIKKAGYSAIVIDKNPKAPGMFEADKALIVSTYNSKKIIKKLKDISHNYFWKGVINRSSGPPVVTASKILRAIGLKGPDPKAARIIVNKEKLMNFCTKNKILAPKIKSIQSRRKLPNGIKFPVVVKPSLSIYGKSGISVVKKRSQLKKAVKLANKLTINNSINIEEEVPGEDVVIMGLVKNKRFLELTFLDEENYVNSSGRINRFSFVVPSKFEKTKVKIKITKIINYLIKKLKLNNCPLNVSFRVAQKKFPHLIEIHLDLGGEFILDKLLPASSKKFNGFSWFVNNLCKYKFNKDFKKPFFKPTAIIFKKGNKLSSKSIKIIKKKTY